MSLGLKGFSLGWGWASIRHPNTWNKGKQNTQSYLLEQDEKQRQLWHTGFTRWCKLVNVKIFWLWLLSPILQGRWSASLKQYPAYSKIITAKDERTGTYSNLLWLHVQRNTTILLGWYQATDFRITKHTVYYWKVCSFLPLHHTCCN